MVAKKVCITCGSDKKVSVFKKSGKRYCTRHYNQMYRYGKIIDPKKNKKQKTCSVCKRPNVYAYRFKGSDEFYCSAHYRQMSKHGKIISENIKAKRNAFKVKESHVEIHFGEDQVGFIDTEDYKHASKFKWHLRNGYVNRSRKSGGKVKHILMHRELMKFPKGLFVDHINGNKLDNRKSNLRVCNNAQNQWNSYKPKGKSKYKGVKWQKIKGHKNGGVWVASIWVNGKAKYLGRFNDDSKAALAYNEAAKKHHGEYARINELKESVE